MLGSVLKEEPPSVWLFYGGGSTVIKADLNNLSTLNTSVSFGGTIYTIAVDDTHVYVGGATDKVRKYLKSDLSYVGETPSYGTYANINSIAIDDDIYVGNNKKIPKKKRFVYMWWGITKLPLYCQ